MREASIKLKMHMRGMSVINNDLEQRILRSILWSFGALALLYILLLGNMVFNIVERKSLEAEAHALTNEVGDLELNYLSASNGIDLDYSHSLGFQEAHATFTTRKSLGLLPGTLPAVKSAQNEI